MNGIKDNIKLSSFKNQIADYLYDSQEKIFNIEANNDSLFMVTRFSSPILSSDKGSVDKKDEAKDECFMLQKYVFTDPSLNMQVIPETNITLLKSVTKVSEVTLSFLDNSKQSFLRYHYEWLSFWYDRVNDRFVNGLAGKYRNLEIVRFKFKNPSALFTFDDSFETVNNIELLSVLSVTGMCPSVIKIPKGDSNVLSSVPMIDFKYKIQSASITYMTEDDETDNTIYNPELKTFFF